MSGRDYERMDRDGVGKVTTGDLIKIKLLK